MAAYRVLKSNAATVSRTFYAADGETPADAAPQSTGVTFTLTRADGTAVTSGTATYLNSTGAYSAVIPAQSRLDVMVLVWTVTGIAPGTQTITDYVEVSGGSYFDLAELRAMDGLSNTTAYPSAALAGARMAAETLVEDYTRIAWVPRFYREILDGMQYTLLQGQFRGVDYKAMGSSATLQLERTPCMTRKIIGVTLSGVSQDLTGWTLSRWGRLSTGGTVFPPATAGQNVDVQYEWGHTYPPEDLKIAAKKIARLALLSTKSSIPDRARIMTTEFATFSLSIASEEFPTGMPEVDSVLQQRREWIPRFA